MISRTPSRPTAVAVHRRQPTFLAEEQCCACSHHQWVDLQNSAGLGEGHAGQPVLEKQGAADIGQCAQGE